MRSIRRSLASSPSTSDPSAPPPPSSTLPSSSSSSWIHLRSLLIIVSSTSSSIKPAPESPRSSLKSPWSRGKRKHALSLRLWRSMFSQDGSLRDGGVKFLKKVRGAGVDPSIRAEVWPFLLGVYNLNSSEDERNSARMMKRDGYENLRRQCMGLIEPCSHGCKSMEEAIIADASVTAPIYDEDAASPASSEAAEVYIPGNSNSYPSTQGDGNNEGRCIGVQSPPLFSSIVEDGGCTSGGIDPSRIDNDSSETCSSDDEEDEPENLDDENDSESGPKLFHRVASIKQGDFSESDRTMEDLAAWKRTIRIDAVRATAEWVMYSPSQAGISEERALQAAAAIGLKDYDHLEPCMVHHAARLVALLEAYALYDPEIGYCQGMSDLLSPIVAVIEEDYLAFWCFVGFMRKARHNFRLDEVGIRRQLDMVAKIIRHKDSHFYKHLQKLQAEDCFFVYRMVVVMFRRELSFEQTLCLWEVMWADQAAIRAGVGGSVWGRMTTRVRVPPNDDLLLFAIAACVLQRRRLIIHKYSSMDEILSECNSIAGRLDVWRLLDDAHGLVVALHDKI